MKSFNDTCQFYTIFFEILVIMFNENSNDQGTRDFLKVAAFYIPTVMGGTRDPVSPHPLQLLLHLFVDSHSSEYSGIS